MLKIRQLDSGYWHVRGDGFCDFAQPPHWPCSKETFLASCSPEASQPFKTEVLDALRQPIFIGDKERAVSERQ